MHKLRYIALGALLMFIGMLTASVLMPNLVAQRTLFDEIETSGVIKCRGLVVVDGDDVVRMILGAIDDNDASLAIFDKNGEPAMQLRHNESAGEINLYNHGRVMLYDTTRRNPKILITFVKGHGVVMTVNKDGKVDGIGGN